MAVLKKGLFVLLGGAAATFLLLGSSAMAAGTAGGTDWSDPILYVKIVSGLIAAVTIVILALGQKGMEHHKKLLFWLITIPVLLTTFYLAGHTVHHNIISVTKGPIHWHADFQVWACGERLDLIDPKGLSNKVGSPLYHEHNDDRVHIEGTVKELQDVNFGTFFRLVNGELRNDGFVYPTNDRVVSLRNGDSCPDGTIGELAVYVNGKRIADPAEYIVYPSIYVPPGDCIVVAFEANPAETTSRICESWAAKDWAYDSFERDTVKVGDHTWQ